MTGKFLSLKNAFVFLFAAAVILTGVTEFFQHSSGASTTLVAAKAEQKLQHCGQKISERLEQLKLLSSEDSIKEAVFNLYDDNSKTYFAGFKDSLFTWSDNNVLILPDEADSAPSGSIIKLRNGWYEIFKADKGDYHFYCVLLIKNEFAYQNKYLVNNFNEELGIPGSYGLSTLPLSGSAPVKNLAGQTLFNLTGGEATDNDGHFSLTAWCYLLVLLLFLGSTYSFGRWLSNKSLLLTIIFSIIVIALRWLMIQLGIPHELYASDLFSPRMYASHAYMNSLGDFLINALLVLCLLLIFLKSFKERTGQISSTTQILIYGGLLIIVLLASLLLNDLLQGIVFNSSINFNTSNVFDLNSYSLTGLLIVALLMFIYFMLVKALVDFQKRFLQNSNKSILLIIVLITVAALIAAVSGKETESHFTYREAALLAMLCISINLFTKWSAGKKFSLTALITFLFITSLYSSLTIYIYSREKEHENRKLLADKVEVEQDRVAEHLFEDLQDKMAEDTVLQSYFAKPASTSFLVSQRLHRRYFNGYWTKFEVGTYCFDANDHPFNKTLDSSSYEQFQTIINTVGKPTYATNLFYLTDPKGKSIYLARIPLVKEDGTKAGTIFIEMEPKSVQTAQGFPELFISDKAAFNNELANYSYARYRNDELVNQYGDFAYYFSASVFVAPEEEYTFVNRDGFNHLLYRENPNTLIVVSKKQDTIYELITSFSYFFAFFSLLLLFLNGLQSLLQRRFSVSLSLKSRIQFSIITIVIFSVTLIGVATVYYIIEKYDANQSLSISTKLKSLLVTIENELDGQLKPDSALPEDVVFKLSQLSNNNSTDFNWYDGQGNLMFSSQPKIFDQGITSTLMNPIAYDRLTTKQKTQFVHPENIGKLNYIAAYQVLTNRQNEFLGYISLPFFEKENELNRDISAFLSALINIYVLLLSLALLVTFLIASLITKPLLLIQEKLANINLGKRNEFIQWDKKDEIGELVKEYNKKVEELALSANLLARSERESAWQEMAMQVAHEIKNPLTPMKLGVQHLLSAYNNNSPDKEELVKKISQTLIQQIDTLTNIANEFSNFAKMPEAKNESVNICSVLSDTINLFKESPDITITFHKENVDAANCFVLADKDQLIRLFSNLLKNAVQSIPSGKSGKVEVSIGENQGVFNIAVKDNGSGIADNQIEKIFTPNFTTKSGGMGLGLAIVKNIVENSSGKVWFETQIGVGTTFFVTLPILL